MKFQKFNLKGKVNYWEEVHTDGGPGTQQIDTDFEAVDCQDAITKAKKIIEEIVGTFPKNGSHGEISFESLKAELRRVDSVCVFEAKAKDVEKTKKVIESEVCVAKKQIDFFTVNNRSSVC